MDNSKVISHRCKNLLKHKGISIRYDCEPFIHKDKRWYMYKLSYNYDYMKVISNIEYCPFCGKKLAEESQTIIKENELDIPVIQGGGKTMREIYNEEYR